MAAAPSGLYRTLFIDPPSEGGIVLGPVTFAAAEHPSELDFGGSQALAVHDLVGGARRVQALGPREHDITWSGMLRDSNAQDRDALLDSLRIAGNQIYLFFRRKTYLVVIKDYVGKFVNDWLINYTITLTVIKNLSAPAQSPPVPSQDSQNAAHFASASLQYANIISVDPSAVPVLETPTLDVQGALAGSVPLSANQTQQQVIQQKAQTAVDAANTYIASVPSPSNAQVASVTGYTNAMQSLMKNVASPIAPLTIQVNGASLEELAAQYYGDPTLSTVIKAANNIVSNFVPSGVLTNLIIPAVSSAVA